MSETNEAVTEKLDDLANREFTAIGGTPGAPDVGQDGVPGEGDPTPLTAAQIIGGALAAGREVFCLVTKLDSPKRVLTDDRAQHLGALWGPVCEKHGIDLAKYLGDYALEVGALVGSFAVVMELRAAVTAEIVAKRGKADTQATEQHGETITV